MALLCAAPSARCYPGRRAGGWATAEATLRVQCRTRQFGLKGKDAVEQFVAIAKTWDYSRMDFVCEVSTNRKAVYLNFLFWAQFNFSAQGIDAQQRDSTIAHMREAWDFNHIKIPLPACR